MKRNLSAWSLLLMSLFLFPGVSFARQKADLRLDHVDINLFAGMEQLDSGDWAPNERMTKLGVDLTYGPTYFSSDFVASLFYSTGSGEKDGFDVKTTLIEGHVGLRKGFIIEAYPEITPSISGGLAAATYTNDYESATDGSGTSAGVFAGTGVIYTYDEKINIGLELRYSYIPVKSGGEFVNAGGLMGGVVAGYRWSTGW